MSGYFLDTNILTRFLLGDVTEQSLVVSKLFLEAKRKKIKLVAVPEVFIELNYALKTHYGLEKDQIIDSIKNVLDFTFIECTNKKTLTKALSIFQEKNISLEDAYYISFSIDNDLDFYSFDKKALKVFKEILA